MKFFKQLIATAALAMCGVVAHADTFVPMDTGAPGVFTDTWTFNDLGTTPHTAGSLFEDIYIFNVPDAQSISVSLVSLLTPFSPTKPDTSFMPGVSFTGGGFVIFTYGEGDTVAYTDATHSSWVGGGSWLLTSGTYGLYVVGTYLVDGGSYAGQIYGAPLAAVPEPSAVLMLLAGMALLAGAAQRRRRG